MPDPTLFPLSQADRAAIIRREIAAVVMAGMLRQGYVCSIDSRDKITARHNGTKFTIRIVLS